VENVARTIAYLKTKYDLAFAIVVGGGNIIRGRSTEGTIINRASADYAGMTATIPNGLILQAYLEAMSIKTRVMSYLEMKQAYEAYIHRMALSHLDAGKVVILVGGLGIPFSSTDLAAAQFAAEFNCALLKGSTVKGIYDKDPNLYPDAVLYRELSYQEALVQGLKVMDGTAFALCQTNKIPIIVFDISDLDNIERIIRGEKIGTLVS
jgi:uridylate kinase